MRRRTKRIVKWVSGCLILTVVAWGLIIYGPTVLEWIKETTAGENIISIRAIHQNLALYENQQVTVIARVTGPVGGIALAEGDEGFNIVLTNLPSGFYVVREKCKITGKVIRTENISVAIEVNNVIKI